MISPARPVREECIVKPGCRYSDHFGLCNGRADQVECVLHRGDPGGVGIADEHRDAVILSQSVRHGVLPGLSAYFLITPCGLCQGTLALSIMP
jgi:hypothetical protein